MEKNEIKNLANKIYLICNYCRMEIPKLNIIIQIDGAYILETCNFKKDTNLIPIFKFINKYYEYEKLFSCNCQKKYNHDNVKIANYFCKTCNILFCKQCILIHNKINKNHICISNDIDNIMNCYFHLKKLIKMDLKEGKNLCEECINNSMKNNKYIINYCDYFNKNEIDNKINNLIELYNIFEKMNLKNYDLIMNEMNDIENKENYLKVLKDSLKYNNEVNDNILKFFQILKNQIINNENLEFNLLNNFKENYELNNYLFSFSSSKNIFENYSSFNKYLRNNFIIKTKLLYSQFLNFYLNTNKGCIDCIIQLSDKRIVSASQYTINFHDNIKYNIIHSIYINNSVIYSLNELQNKKLISGSENGEIKIWNVIEYYQLILSIKIHEKPIWGIMNLNNDKFIVISENPIIKIYNISTFENINIDSKEDSLISLIILKDNRFLIGATNGNIRIFNSNNFKVLKVLNLHSNGVNYIYELHDGRIASASSDKTIKIWDSFSGEIFSTLYGHNNNIEVLLQYKNSLLISASWDGCIKFWDIFKYQCFFSSQIHYNLKCLCICQIENGFIINYEHMLYFYQRNEEKKLSQIIKLN